MKSNPKPQVPKNLNPLAREVLEELSQYPGSSEIIIGGGVALQHYLPFRQTVDVDAWWAKGVSEQGLDAVERATETVALRHGYEVDKSSKKESHSFAFKKGEQKQFSFQIALRSLEIDPPFTSAWSPIKIETLQDNLAGKMNALVKRGAPRDYVDVHNICRQGLATPKECWDLWQKRNPKAEICDAASTVVHSLKSIEDRRPLETIKNLEERANVENARAWFKTDFIRDIRQEYDLGY